MNSIANPFQLVEEHTNSTHEGLKCMWQWLLLEAFTCFLFHVWDEMPENFPTCLCSFLWCIYSARRFSKPPFEPLESTSDRILTLKTVLLLALHPLRGLLIYRLYQWAYAVWILISVRWKFLSIGMLLLLRHLPKVTSFGGHLCVGRMFLPHTFIIFYNLGTDLTSASGVLSVWTGVNSCSSINLCICSLPDEPEVTKYGNVVYRLCK